MRAIAPVILAYAALAAATHFGGAHHSSTLTARQGENLELQCSGTSLFCCDELKDEDRDESQPVGTGDYRNCSTVVNSSVSACSLKRDCQRTPVCCQYSEGGGPIPNPMGGRSLQAILEENGEGDLLVCKEGESK